MRYSEKERPLFFLKGFLDLAIRSTVRCTMLACHNLGFREDPFQLQPSIQPTAVTMGWLCLKHINISSEYLLTEKYSFYICNNLVQKFQWSKT